MITAKELKELISKLPDDATLAVYDGPDGVGIRVDYSPHPDDSGWIEIGLDDDIECDSSKHDLKENTDIFEMASKSEIYYGKIGGDHCKMQRAEQVEQRLCDDTSKYLFSES